MRPAKRRFAPVGDCIPDRNAPPPQGRENRVPPRQAEIWNDRKTGRDTIALSRPDPHSPNPNHQRSPHAHPRPHQSPRPPPRRRIVRPRHRGVQRRNPWRVRPPLNQAAYKQRWRSSYRRRNTAGSSPRKTRTRTPGFARGAAFPTMKTRCGILTLIRRSSPSNATARMSNAKDKNGGRNTPLHFAACGGMRPPRPPC